MTPLDTLQKWGKRTQMGDLFKENKDRKSEFRKYRFSELPVLV
jgi:hypothetical protein